MSKPQWCVESVIRQVRVSYEATSVLADLKTAQQHAVVFENEEFGRVLMLDGAIQTTTRDEFIYHEMLAHVPLLAHGNVVDVLIVGGGDGGLAKEILKHTTVRTVTQVEIDPDVVEISRKYLHEMNAQVFSDARFELHHADGVAFVNETHRSFDVVLVDSTDPLGAACALFTTEFYAAARRRLKPGGMLIAQMGVPFLQASSFGAAMRNLAGVFPATGCYLLAAASYFGGHLALGWASEGPRPDAVDSPTLVERYSTRRIQTRYYTPEVHKAAFALPPYIAEMFAP